MVEIGIISTPDDDHENYPGLGYQGFRSNAPLQAYFWQLASTFIVLLETESILALKLNIYQESH